MEEPFKGALPVLQAIEGAGFEASFVGGSVRDLLIGKEIHDVDIATSATPEEIKDIFPKTIDVGISHGTVIILYHSQMFEVTSYRSEANYEDFRRPSEVVFIRSLKEDLARRDFTMNALAMNQYGEVYDPFGGTADINAKLIRTVGNAKERFSEDALRILRAVRFLSQLSFTLESETYEALKIHAPLLIHIAVERKLNELDKLMSGENLAEALKILVDTSIYEYIAGLEELTTSFTLAANLKMETLSLDEKWALLFYLQNWECHSKVKASLQALRFPKKRLQTIVDLTYWLKRRENQPWSTITLYEAGKNTVTSVEKIQSILHPEKQLEGTIADLMMKFDTLPISSVKDISVTGDDLMEWLGKPGGPWIKELIKEIEKCILSGQLTNDYNAIKEWVVKCNLI